MAVSSKVYEYLARWCVEGMEKAHAEQIKEAGKGKPLRGMGKSAYKYLPAVDAMLTDLFELRLCKSREKNLLITEDYQNLYAYNGERFEQVTIKMETFVAELAKRTLRELEVGALYVQKTPRNMANAVVGTLISTEEYVYKSERRYIAFSNGVYDLDKRKLCEFSPNFNPNLSLDLEYMSSDEAYRLGAKEIDSVNNPCKLWDKKLKEILPNAEFRDAFQQWCGSLLVDPDIYTREYVCYLIGPGANGKSVLANVVSQVFGLKYFSHFTPRQMFKDSDRGANIAALKGKLANMVDDLNDRDMSGGDYKRFASGQAFEARIPYDRKPITVYAPPMLCCTNEMPQQRDFSNGNMRRQLIIHANPRSLTPDEQDPELATKLTTPIGRIYIFNWILSGYYKVIRNNGRIKLGEDVLKAINMVMDNSNSLRRWWKENRYIEVSEPEKPDSRWRPLKYLWQEYLKFCENEGSIPRARYDLSQFLRNKDFEDKRNVRTVGGCVEYCIGKIDSDSDKQGEALYEMI